MKIDTTRGTFEEIIAGCSPEMAAIAIRLRETIAGVCPDAVEVPRPGERHSEYGIERQQGPGIFAYICPLKDYIRLGFYYGGSLPDPARLLVGEGKRLRHIKIYSLADAGRPEIADLLRAAVIERQQT